MYIRMYIRMYVRMCMYAYVGVCTRNIDKIDPFSEDKEGVWGFHRHHGFVPVEIDLTYWM